MKREHYKKFIIEARSSLLKDGSGWDSEFDIEKHDSAGVAITGFYLTHIYKTEKDALEAALSRGRFIPRPHHH